MRGASGGSGAELDGGSCCTRASDPSGNRGDLRNLGLHMFLPVFSSQCPLLWLAQCGPLVAHKAYKAERGGRYLLYPIYVVLLFVGKSRCFSLCAIFIVVKPVSVCYRAIRMGFDGMEGVLLFFIDV